MAEAAAEGFSGEQARQARLQMGLTQFVVAVELGITPQHLSNFELGRSHISPKVRYRLAQLLDLPLPDLPVQPESRLQVLEDRMAEITTQLAVLSEAVQALVAESRSTPPGT